MHVVVVESAHELLMVPPKLNHVVTDRARNMVNGAVGLNVVSLAEKDLCKIINWQRL